MAFLNRVFSYLANEVLVKGLANSATFQRIAVKTDALASELRHTSLKNVEELTQDVAKKGSTFAKTFKDEIQKELDKMPKK